MPENMWPVKPCSCQCGCENLTVYGVCPDCVGGLHKGVEAHGLHCYDETARDAEGHMRLVCGWPERHRR